MTTAFGVTFEGIQKAFISIEGLFQNQTLTPPPRPIISILLICTTAKDVNMQSWARTRDRQEKIFLITFTENFRKKS